MTVQLLLKVVDREDDIEIIDTDLPIDKNVLYRGEKQKMPKATYLRIRDKHVSGVFAYDNTLCISADVTAKEKALERSEGK